MEKRREGNAEFKDLKDQVLEQAETMETPEPEKRNWITGKKRPCA